MTAIRHALAPYLFDGTEALSPIGVLLRSPHRPPDHQLADAIGTILKRIYQDTVTIDAVVNFVEIKGFHITGGKCPGHNSGATSE